MDGFTVKRECLEQCELVRRAGRGSYGSVYFARLGAAETVNGNYSFGASGGSIFRNVVTKLAHAVGIRSDESKGLSSRSKQDKQKYFAIKVDEETPQSDAFGWTIGVAALREICAYQRLVRKTGTCNVPRIINVCIGKPELKLCPASDVGVGEVAKEDFNRVIKSKTAVLMDAYDCEGRDDLSSFTLSDIRELMAGVLSALSAMHSVDILHRDVKLCNILWGTKPIERHNVALADLGSSRFVHVGKDGGAAHCSGDKHSCVAYTLPYRPLEIMLSRGIAYSAAMDMWAAGMTMYHMCTGRLCGDVDDSFSEYGVIVDIFKIFGTPSIDKWPDLNLMTEWNEGRAFPKFEPRPFSAFRGTHLASCPPALDLLHKLLAYDPTERITASEACAHPFLSVSPYESPQRSIPPAPRLPRSIKKMNLSQLGILRFNLYLMLCFCDERVMVNMTTVHSTCRLAYRCLAHYESLGKPLHVVLASCMIVNSKLYDVDCIDMNVGTALSSVLASAACNGAEGATLLNIVECESLIVQTFNGDLYAHRASYICPHIDTLEDNREAYDICFNWFCKWCSASCITEVSNLEEKDLERSAAVLSHIAVCILLNIPHVSVWRLHSNHMGTIDVTDCRGNRILRFDLPVGFTQDDFRRQKKICLMLARIHKQMSTKFLSDCTATHGRMISRYESRCELFPIVLNIARSRV